MLKNISKLETLNPIETEINSEVIKSRYILQVKKHMQ